MEVAYEAAKAEGLEGWKMLNRMKIAEAAILADAAAAGEAADSLSIGVVSDIVKARARLEKINHTFGMVGERATFLLGFDGSEGSDLAWSVCLEELMKSRDAMHIVHAFDSTKDSAKAKALKESVEVKLMAHMAKSRYTLTWVDKAGKDTRAFMTTLVNELAHHHRASFFVTGFTDRKKGNSLALHSAGKFHMPNIIVKKKPVANRPRVLVACVKDPHNCPQYDVAVELMKPGMGDKIIILHIYDEKFSGDETDQELAKFAYLFEKRFAEDGIAGAVGSKFLPLAHSRGTPVHELIVQQIAELSADYVVMAPTLEKVDHTMKHVLLGADCNIVVCKR
jgi:hypothetical protein